MTAPLALLAAPEGRRRLLRAAERDAGRFRLDERIQITR